MRAIYSYGIALVIVLLLAVWLGTGTLVNGGRGPGNGEKPVISLIEKNGGPLTSAVENSGVNNKAAAFSMVHCAPTDAQAREEAERAFMSYVGTTLAVTASIIEARKTGANPKEVRFGSEQVPRQYEGIDPSKVNLDYLIDNGMCICGSPDTCIKQLERLQAQAQLDQFLCMMQFWPIPHEKTMRSIELWGKHVIPHFQSEGRSATAAATALPGAR